MTQAQITSINDNQGTRWELRSNAIGAYDVYSVMESNLFGRGEYPVALDMPIEDARLIAAAPNLLKTLAKCRPYVAESAINDPGIGGRLALDALDSAIANAKGGTP